jgi:hypothetical protein
MKDIVAKTKKMPLGILIDKEFQDIDQVFIPIFKSDDSFFDYAQKLIYNNNSKSPFWMLKDMKNNFVIQSAVTSLEQIHPNNLAIVTDKVVSLPFLEKQDLMLISLESWKSLDSDSE